MSDLRASYDDLLLDRVLYGLEDNDEARFHELESRFGGFERRRMERAVAAIHVALLGELEPVPPPLRRDLEVQAHRWMPRRPPPESP